MTERIAASLDQLRSQINKASPGRSTSSDGWIGDRAHRLRKSDHNPDPKGIVRALDVTNDPLHGVDSARMSEAIRLSKDPRIDYLICNRRISYSGRPWQKYTGTNPHTLHFHLSVVDDDRLADSRKPWIIGDTAGNTEAPAVEEKPFLKQGSKGPWVEHLQTRLADLGYYKAGIDGDFGPKTKAAVEAVQKRFNLTVDGKVGPYTWAVVKKEKS